MNTLFTTPDVRVFVTAVRERLSDLTEEEREELVGGLEADMSDLVAEQGVDALPDPATYAAELRAAAGFAPQQGGVVRGRRDAVMAWLDRGSVTWNRWVQTGDHGGLPALVASLRPVWWVTRGVCAAALAVEMFSSQGVFGFTPRRALLAAVLVLVSVQIGRGRWWPGTRLRRSLDLRLTIGLLNLAAVALLPVMAQRFLTTPAWLYDESAANTGFDAGLSTEGIFSGGRQVQNVFPYDAQGRPLTGVQLVDQDGRRLVVKGRQYDADNNLDVVLAPWHNDHTQLYSVFPLGQQSVDPDTGKPVAKAGTKSDLLPEPPYDSLPPVAMDGVTPSRLVGGTRGVSRRQHNERRAHQRGAGRDRHHGN